MTLFDERNAPWYKKLARFLPDTISLRCFCCLLFFGVFFTIAGMIMTGSSYSGPPRTFRTLAEAKRKEIETVKIVGPVILSAGLAILVISLFLRFRLSLWRKFKEKAVEKSNHVQPELVFMDNFQMRDAISPIDREFSLDSPSTSTNSIDSRKKIADKMLY